MLNHQQNMNDKRGNGSTYEYDPTGRLTKRTWARGIETDYSYNPLGQLTNLDYSDDTPDVAFTYNRMGQQTTVTDATGTRGFAYDSHLQLIQETNWQATIERSFDTFGRPTSLTLGTNYSVSYTYDSYSRLSTVADFNYTYLPNSDLIASVHNGNLQTTTTYEPPRNLKTSISNTFNGTLISSFDYTYDAIGRRTERLDSNTITNEFAYNPRSELISAQMGTNSFQYHYDPIGNRQHAIANTQTNLYQSNELNQYTNITPTPEALTYDLDGNMLSDGMWHYTWDAENRLISVSSNNNLVVQNHYDYMSRRITKTTAITTNTFTYDNWNLISESSTAHINNNYYIWGLDLSATLQGAGGVGGLLARVHNDSDPLSYTYDANGNGTDILATNGIIVAHYKYDAFGNTIAKSGTHSGTSPFQFSTKYLDIEVELYCFGYRFYSPTLGKWLNRDPISEHGGRHLYAFVGNSPVNWIDPVGLRGNDPPFQISAACCAGEVFSPSRSCCYNDMIIPIVKDSVTNYKVCCRETIDYSFLQHCEIKVGACDFGENAYDISKISVGSMDNKKPCKCVDSADVAACLERNPYSAGSGKPGNNCQSNTVSRLKKCCLSSSWRPNFYGYPL